MLIMTDRVGLESESFRSIFTPDSASKLVFFMFSLTAAKQTKRYSYTRSPENDVYRKCGAEQ